MKAKRLSGALLIVGLSFTAVAAHAAKPKPAKEMTTPVTKAAITLALPGVGWGQSPTQVGEAVDKLIDDEYQGRYKEAQPGPALQQLEAQVAEDKSQFRRSRIDFGKLPTGVDASPLRGEFTYNNRESLMTFTRKGQVVELFFIQDRLWKIIEERKLSESSVLGKTYPDAAVKLASLYGVAGRVQQPDATHGSLEIDWKDSNTHLRAIQRSDTSLALAFEDNTTLGNLGSLRMNKPVESNGIDPSVAAFVNPNNAGPIPPPAAANKKK